ncbi:serine protease homolog 29 precursor [Nasonia vitripennis]|uniref:trypsin n=1 Tax=Nasonia vitripennis TaxID=7425 RepID=A0A7M6UV29_NASVI|nr:serine protease homolog 29 precursor [Nasonia vitripennis]
MEKLFFLFLLSGAFCFHLGDNDEAPEDVVFGDYPDAMKSGIVGGDYIEIDEAPYTAQILENGKHICGAVIISEYWLLTAAHCVSNIQTPSIITGSSFRQRGGHNHTIAKIIVNEKFDYQSIDNDIALVQVQEHIDFNELQQAIEISNISPKIGDLIEIAGYGATGLTEPASETLKSAVLPVVEQKECYKGYDLEHEEHAHNFLENMFCASAEGADACQGDGGGPVVSRGKLVGIISFAMDCELSKTFSIYTLVSNYLQWIQDHTGIKLLV